MKRSIMKIGPSTLVISLPASWIRKTKAKKGQELDVEEKGITLQISAEGNKAESKTATLDISSLNPIIMKSLGCFYKLGYSGFNLSYDNDKKTFLGKDYSELSLIRRALQSFSGIDIKEIKASKESRSSSQRSSRQNLVAVERAKIEYNEFDNTFNQSFFHLKLLLKSVEDALEGKGITKDYINSLDDLLNQTTNFCMRCLVLYGYEDYRKTAFLFSVIEKLEQIGDTCVKIMDSLENGIKPSKDAISVFEDISSILELLHRIYQKFRKDDLLSLASDVIKADVKITALSRKADKKEFMLIMHLYHLNQSISEIIEPTIAFFDDQIVES